MSNLTEILTGHFPGDGSDKPTAAEVANASKLRAAFEQYRKSYQWHPFEQVQRPPLPMVRNRAWVRNPIDAFVAAEHEARGLKPRPEAARHSWLRRVTLDLAGLPPTRTQLHAFLSDTSSEAYEKVVDRLLASPRYGERWGRHWMDVWRYSDWAGFGQEVRESQPHIWHWRDWIIESLNQDKGYDRMIQEMLAGDELAPTDAATLRATGFLVRNWFSFNRNVWLDNTVEHTAKAFLGVTINCARCHEHMFDPVAQKEYYAFRAFFEPYNIRTDRLPGQPDLTRDGIPRVYDKDLNTPTYLFIRGNDADPDKSKAIAPAVPAVFSDAAMEIQPVHLPRTAYMPDKQGFVVQETIRASEQQVVAVRKAVGEAQKELDRRHQSVAGLREAEKASWAAVLEARQKLDANLSGSLQGWMQALSEASHLAEEVTKAQQQVRVAEDQIRLAHMKQALAGAAHAALLATLRVEKLEDTGVRQSDPETWRTAALAANRAQRE
ncbi:MAG: DUF1549 domain-containing protein, partial [Planctomycetota bacterium]